MTLAAPQWFHLRHGEHSYPKDVYANDNEYFADIAKAYREELADLYDAGCRNVQFDDPLLAYFVSLSLQLLTYLTRIGKLRKYLLS
jgi:methionine synthase II (cobalamin-independent)